MSELLGRAWSTYKANFAALVGLFALVYLVLTPLPFLLAFEVPIAARIPMGVMLQVAAPVFAGSVAMTVASRRLATGTTFGGAWREIPTRAALAAAGVAALIAVLLATLPFGVFLVLVLLHGLFGPPLVAQVIGMDGASLREALRRTGEIGSLRTSLYLLNVVIGTGLIAMLSLGGFATGVVDAPTVMRSVVAPVFQAAVMGLLVGFLAAFEYELVVEARATAGAASPD